jgi:hypothetical protein
LLFSITAGAGALGHHLCSKLLRYASARTLIGASAAGSVGAVHMPSQAAPVFFVGTPIFGLAIGVSTTAAYTAAGTVIPASARGRFRAPDHGVARRPRAEPGSQRFPGCDEHPRAVFVLDAVALIALAGVVTRLDDLGELGIRQSRPKRQKTSSRMYRLNQ